MTNKNEELQERCEAIMYRCADKEDEFGGQTYKSLIDLKFQGVVEEIIQEVKKSMGSVELDSIINHVTGLVLKTHSVVESTRNLDLIGLFPELRKLQSDLLLLQPPKSEPVDVLIDDYQEWEDRSFEGSCGYCGNRLYSHSAYLSCDECNTKAKWPLSQSPRQTNEQS